MTRYSIHALDPQGGIAGSRTMQCRDDLDALSAGVAESSTHPVEIWDGERLVARVKLGNAPLNDRDPHSL